MTLYRYEIVFEAEDHETIWNEQHGVSFQFGAIEREKLVEHETSREVA